MARLAIIDDAICDNFLSQPVSERYCLRNNMFVKKNLCENNEMSHGTLVAKVLEQYAINYEIISVQIIDNWFQSRRCSSDLLKKALDFCAELDCDAINISLGTKRLSEAIALLPSLKKVQFAGTPIVAACSNTFHRTIPAAMDEVFGVICDLQNELPFGAYAVSPDPYLGTDYIANYAIDFSENAGTRMSNSLATAVVTAKINNILNQKKCTHAELVSELNKDAEKLTIKKENTSFDSMKPTTIPTVYLVDILASEKDKQFALLDLFAEDGYEVIAASDIDGLSDARFLKLSNLGSNAFAELQNRICTCAKVDLAIVFAPAEWVIQLNWIGFDKESALFVCNNDELIAQFAAPTELQYKVFGKGNVYCLYKQLRKYL